MKIITCINTYSIRTDASRDRRKILPLFMSTPKDEFFDLLQRGSLEFSWGGDVYLGHMCIRNQMS